MNSLNKSFGSRAAGLLMAGTILGGSSTAAWAQGVPAVAPAAQIAAAAEGVVRSVSVTGNQRLEPETIRAYANLAIGDTYTATKLDQSLKDLYATQLFADVTITGADTGNLIIEVKENPVINRIILEGNKRLKDDKISPEIKSAPRQIFTRSSVRADVDRILELYRREGRFAARVEPKIVQLDQNRVDVVFEISEGELAKVRAINIIGNANFSDGRVQKEMYTKKAGGILGFLKQNDTYDPDRLAADQQKLRAFYLTQGYADFRVVSALAELTPDRRDFVITYVVEEGPRYKFGTVEADSAVRDLPNDQVKALVQVTPGTWFNAKKIEDAVTRVEEAAGNLGYAFADVSPAYERDSEKMLMNITVKVGQTPRVYVERIDITGNTTTRDKVIRREFRLNEGDAFNAVKLKRSQDRIESLGFFQQNLEIKQTEGSAPDRVVLGLNVQEKPTGQIQFSGGYSSLERFILQLGLSQNNFLGKGQQLDASVNYSRYSRSASIGFVEPYFLDKQILLGGQIFRRDYSSFNFVGKERQTTYKQTSTGMSLRTGFPVTEFVSFGARYSLVKDDITLNKSTFFTAGVCDPLKAGAYLCDEIGGRTTSSLGYSVLFDNTDGIRPTRGQRLTLSQDFAGLGGNVRYLRSTANGTKYHGFGDGWVLSLHGEGGLIFPLQKKPSEFRDAIRLTDRFFGPQLRGFDIRGIGPRVQRLNYKYETINGVITPVLDDSTETTQDALGGRTYYMGRLELEFPVPNALKSAGIRPSAFVDAGSLFNITKPRLTDAPVICGIKTGSTGIAAFQSTKADCTTIIDSSTGAVSPFPGTSTNYTGVPGVREIFAGNSASPRLSIGVGFNWISPFGPLRIDIAKAILKQRGDDTKFFSFNVGTSF
ncbi:MAG: outer membrane protein assembly factor BamA [Sphingomicrobium sp.]